MNILNFRKDWLTQPRDHIDYKDRWLHSDLKVMAYPYVYPLFDDFVKRGELK